MTSEQDEMRKNGSCKDINVTGPPGALSFDVKPEIAQEKSL